jgi:hypothetical protein
MTTTRNQQGKGRKIKYGPMKILSGVLEFPGKSQFNPNFRPRKPGKNELWAD